MQDYEWWWVIAGVLGVAEVFTGTFYILVLAISAAAASVLAKFGLAMPWQVLGAAIVALLGWFWLRRRKTSDSIDVPELDVGEWIDVDSWRDGIGSAQYRGAHWSVEADWSDAANHDAGRPSSGGGPMLLKPGKYRIQALRGNRLIVDPRS
jgi:membrane protein implicated in regulation of membrane protease activity